MLVPLSLFAGAGGGPQKPESSRDASSDAPALRDASGRPQLNRDNDRDSISILVWYRTVLYRTKTKVPEQQAFG